MITASSILKKLYTMASYSDTINPNCHYTREEKIVLENIIKLYRFNVMSPKDNFFLVLLFWLGGAVKGILR